MSGPRAPSAVPSSPQGIRSHKAPGGAQSSFGASAAPYNPSATGRWWPQPSWTQTKTAPSLLEKRWTRYPAPHFLHVPGMGLSLMA